MRDISCGKRNRHGLKSDSVVAEALSLEAHLGTGSHSSGRTCIRGVSAYLLR
jgi:hypothetical protein